MVLEYSLHHSAYIFMGGGPLIHSWWVTMFGAMREDQRHQGDYFWRNSHDLDLDKSLNGNFQFHRK